jgi:uncharacterized membrane protein
VYRDKFNRVRLIETDPSYDRMVNRSFDKVRQAARGMPAVIIRMLDALAIVAAATMSHQQRRVLTRQAEMILRAAEESVSEPNDLEDIRNRYQRLMALAAAADDPEVTRSSTPQQVSGID